MPARPDTADWHQLDIPGLLERLGTSASGLSAGEAAARLAKYGPNALKEKPGRSPLSLFLGQFRDFMILVLIGAALVSGLIGEFLDGAVILAIVLLNAAMGFAQEYRAQKAMDALKKMAAPTASVIRDGLPSSVPAAGLVPGDLVLLEAGAIVPADLRVTECAALKTDEAALTGESVPVEKTADVLPESGLQLGDRRNMAYSGTAVTYGRGSGVVTATGMATELGRIAGLLQEEEEVATPLQRRMAAFGKKLAWAILGICAAVFAAGLLRGEDPGLMFLTAVSLAVAAIPEALPAVMSIALALGAAKLVRKQALIRRLPAVETLGSVTYICSDKTGTLTQNRMAAARVFLGGAMLPPGGPVPAALREHWAALLTAAALNNDSRPAAGGWTGDPTETALCVLAEKSGLSKRELDRRYPRAAELPFDSGRKAMTTFHSGPLAGDAPFFSVTKGAAESLLDSSDFVLGMDGGKEETRRAAEEMASGGLRVLGFAFREWDSIPPAPSPDTAERGLTFIGLVGLEDPPREEAKAAVAECAAAGIVPVMITGDHPVTALSIAGRLGIAPPGPGCMLTGRELETMTEEELLAKVESVRVYARVAPEQKLRVLKALQRKGQYAAMTGDGVNDAPALKRADIGVAMGIAGTDVSKEAAHMILLDDNFATIVRAVREGRRIYGNIRRFIRYILTCNSAEIWTISLAPFLGMPIPLLPIQILWINLVTDGLPGLAMTSEPAEADVMRRPPRPPGESLFAGGMGAQIVWAGLLMAAVCLGTQYWGIAAGKARWRTMVFTVLCLSQLGQALAIRSEKRTLWELGPLTNGALLGAVALTVALQLCVIYIPVCNRLFGTAPLAPGELALALALSAVVYGALEAEKLLRRAARK